MVFLLFVLTVDRTHSRPSFTHVGSDHACCERADFLALVLKIRKIGGGWGKRRRGNLLDKMPQDLPTGEMRTKDGEQPRMRASV
jgi:hypothetical protein